MALMGIRPCRPLVPRLELDQAFLVVILVPAPPIPHRQASLAQHSVSQPRRAQPQAAAQLHSEALANRIQQFLAYLARPVRSQPFQEQRGLAHYSVGSVPRQTRRQAHPPLVDLVRLHRRAALHSVASVPRQTPRRALPPLVALVRFHLPEPLPSVALAVPTLPQPLQGCLAVRARIARQFLGTYSDHRMQSTAVSLALAPVLLYKAVSLVATPRPTSRDPCLALAVPLRRPQHLASLALVSLQRARHRPQRLPAASHLATQALPPLRRLPRRAASALEIPTPDPLNRSHRPPASALAVLPLSRLPPMRLLGLSTLVLVLRGQLRYPRQPAASALAPPLRNRPQHRRRQTSSILVHLVRTIRRPKLRASASVPPSRSPQRGILFSVLPDRMADRSHCSAIRRRGPRC